VKAVASIGCLLAVLLLSDVARSESAAVSLPKGILALAPRTAPDLILNDLDGQQFDLAQFRTQDSTQSSHSQRGRWVFVHFWASWCGPCRREIPAIQRMLEKFAEPPFEVAIVNTAESEDTVFTFLGVLAPDIVPLMDSDGVVTEAWKPRGLPSTYLVDPNGKIRFQVLGGRPWDEAAYLQFLTTLKNL